MSKSVYLPRILKLPESKSFFLFGPRASGKSTLIAKIFKEKSIYIDLLDYELENKFNLNPNELIKIIKALPGDIQYVIIDEIQKIPKLLDLVHKLIETTDKKFILTGSSARKLKRGGANLLAGRALVFNLYPFSYFEIESLNPELKSILEFGLIPKIFELESREEKISFLQAYAHSYLKEEIWAEQFIRELDPFRKFLEIASQMNGKIINFKKIADDTGVNEITVKKYYEILEDTLIGFFLEPFAHSFRKRLRAKPKFYFFDTGVNRALSRNLSLALNESTYAYGEAFEHFIILEAMKLASYFRTEYRFSYLQTKDDAEIDLIVDRPGERHLFIEIKSSNNVTEGSIRTFANLVKDFGDCEAVCFSNDPYEKILDNGIRVMPWKPGLAKYFKF